MPHAVVLALITATVLVYANVAAGTPARQQERVPPTVIESVEPEYPPEEREKGIIGQVHLEAVVRADGTAEVIRVVRSLGEAFDTAAISALEQWVFEPGTLGGEPTDVRLRIEVNFSLE